MVQAHEDKIAKINDDRKVYETKGNQLRKDIREFEKLCVDVSQENRQQVHELGGQYRDDLNKMLAEVDDVRRHNKELERQCKFSRDVFNHINGQMAWQKHSIEQLRIQVEDLPVFKNQLIATDEYLAKVLPYKIQDEIYKSGMAITRNNREAQLSLLEYTDMVFEDLQEDFAAEDFKFDKQKFHIPDLKNQMDTLRQLLGDARPASSLGSSSKAKERMNITQPSLGSKPASRIRKPSALDKPSTNESHRSTPYNPAEISL